MIIIQCGGGLGNQLFVYALYYKMKRLGKDVRIDTCTVYKPSYTRPFELDYLGLKYEKATQNEIDILYADKSTRMVSRIRRKVLGRTDSVVVEKKQKYYEYILNLSNAYLVGAWQTEKYFKDLRSELLQELDFSDKIDKKNLELLDLIRQKKAVSLHIRRGDYLLPENQKLFGGVCTTKYYEWAMEYIQERVPDAHYFIFSNDGEWAREHFGLDKATIVNLNSEKDGYRDLYLMSQCQHNIIANSSFSWWGAWLNTNPNKIVIAPSTWYKEMPAEDIYCEGWIRCAH